MDEAIEISAMRKIYIRLLPFAILSYFLAYVDRMSFAGLTMGGGLKMSATAYGFDDEIGRFAFLRCHNWFRRR